MAVVFFAVCNPVCSATVLVDRVVPSLVSGSGMITFNLYVREAALLLTAHSLSAVL